MATIEFRGKIQQAWNPDDTPAYRYVKVPVLARRHCDMDAFRRHPRFGGVANSDLFPGILARIRRDRLGDYVRLDRIPEGVTVDESGFLAVVRIDV